MCYIVIIAAITSEHSLHIRHCVKHSADISHVSLTTILWYYYPQLIDKKTKTWRGEETCLGSNRIKITIHIFFTLKEHAFTTKFI